MCACLVISFIVASCLLNCVSGGVDAETRGMPPTAMPPSNLHVVNITGLYVELSFNDESNMDTNFIIERSTDNVTFIEIDNVSLPYDVHSNDVHYTDNSVTELTAYFYRVRAANSTAITEPSNTVNCTTGLAEPTDFVLLLATDDTACFRWKDNSGSEEQYSLEYVKYRENFSYPGDAYYVQDGIGTVHQAARTMDYSLAGTTGADECQYTLMGLKPNTTYFFRVRARTGDSDSTASDYVIFTTARVREVRQVDSWPMTRDGGITYEIVFGEGISFGLWDAGTHEVWAWNDPDNDDGAGLMVSSFPRLMALDTGESLDVDLDTDGWRDLRITLLAVDEGNGTATLNFKALSPPPAPETEEGFSTLTILSIIALVAVAGMVTAVVILRRRQ